VGVLETILATKREEVSASGNQRLPAPPTQRPVELSRSAGQELSIIAENQARSPSAGPLSTDLSVAERARAYERAGARMVSVLCDARSSTGALHSPRRSAPEL